MCVLLISHVNYFCSVVFKYPATSEYNTLTHLYPTRRASVLLSAIKTESWSFSIEPVELHRAYPPKTSAPVSGVPSETVRNTGGDTGNTRSEEHTSELQSLMRTSYDVSCLKT